MDCRADGTVLIAGRTVLIIAMLYHLVWMQIIYCYNKYMIKFKRR